MSSVEPSPSRPQDTGTPGRPGCAGTPDLPIIAKPVAILLRLPADGQGVPSGLSPLAIGP